MKFFSILLGVAIVFATPTLIAQHSHLDVGATGTNQGSALRFDNGPVYADTNEFVRILTLATSGKYSNYYQGNITLTALHAVDALGDPVPNGPATGSFLVAQIFSVEGPAGGAFAFWETNSTLAPTLLVPSGTISNSAALFDLSDRGLGAGTPGGDPYGHHHGRRFSATKPGVYRVGFRVIDTSTNGNNGGPIHSPSGVLHVFFQAGYVIKAIERSGGEMHHKVGTAPGFDFVLQRRERIESGIWTNITSVRGAERFQTVTDTNAAGPTQFYRIQVTPTPQ